MSLYADELEGRRMVVGLYGSGCEFATERKKGNAQKAELS